MLYRAPRLSLVSIARSAAARVAGAFAEFRRSDTDTAYLDSLPEHHLRDLGLRRHEDRHFNERFYR